MRFAENEKNIHSRQVCLWNCRDLTKSSIKVALKKCERHLAQTHGALPLSEDKKVCDAVNKKEEIQQLMKASDAICWYNLALISHLIHSQHVSKTACFPSFARVSFLVRRSSDPDQGWRLVLSSCEQSRATGEALRRDTSKCLFMPNWATDEPAAISDNSLSRGEGEKEGRKGGDGGVMKWRRGRGPQGRR